MDYPLTTARSISDVSFVESVEDDNLMLYLCKQCETVCKEQNCTITAAQFSLCSGVDFGVATRLAHLLPPLSILEKAIIARIRVYAIVLKCTETKYARSKLNGHVIAIQHDSAQKLSKRLPDIIVSSIQ